MKSLVGRLCITAMLIASVQAPVLAGVVFTIDSTDIQTGESLGSMEILVEGTQLKMTFLDSEEQRVEVARDIEHVPEMTIVDESDSASDVSGISGAAVASASEAASVSAYTDTQTNDNKNSGEMVYHADRREIVVIDHESEEYFVIDEAFLDTMKEKLGDVSDQMSEVSSMMQQAYEAAMAQLDAQGLSPQERAAAEQVLRNTFNVASSPTAIGEASLDVIEGKKVNKNGYSTTHYGVINGVTTVRELWVTDWNNLGPGAKAQATVESYFNFFAKMSSGQSPLSGDGDGDIKFFQAMDKIGGFPVAGKDFEDGRVDEEWTLESVTERDLDPDAFEPPSGYSLRTMGGFSQ